MINLNRYFCHYYKWDSVEGFHKKAFQFKAMGKDKNATMDNEFSAGLQFYFWKFSRLFVSIASPKLRFLS